MEADFQGYDLFYQFINAYAPFGFRGIDRNNPLVLRLEDMMEQNNQYFFIADLFQAKILFTSKRSMQMIGIKPEELNPYHAIEAAHPDDVYRNTRGWAKLLQMANDLLGFTGGSSLLSVNMKLRNPAGDYREILFQCYLFYKELPYKTVYSLQVHTDISHFKMKKIGYHYYTGNDLMNFRYPDQELLMLGHPFSKREFEIIKLIALGLNSYEIAEKLFISTNTVNTHRRNILLKTSTPQLSDLIYSLKDQGII